MPGILLYMTYSEFMQQIYEAFLSVSNPLRECLEDDVKELESRINSLDSDKIVSMASHIGLKTIGFLWELVKYSTEFKRFGKKNSEWFRHFIAKRTVSYRKMTVSTYLHNLSK